MVIDRNKQQYDGRVFNSENYLLEKIYVGTKIENW